MGFIFFCEHCKKKANTKGGTPQGWIKYMDGWYCPDCIRALKK